LLTPTLTKELRMTDEIMALRGLMEKSADADFLREMIGFGAQRLMELEVGVAARRWRGGPYRQMAQAAGGKETTS